MATVENGGLRLGRASGAFGHHPPRQARRGAGPAPRAGGDADAAALGVVEVGNAFVEIDEPLGDAANNLFFAEDGVGRTRRGAHPAIGAELVDGDVVGLVGDQRQIGEHAREPERRAMGPVDQ